jgi:hypothetical protein
MKAGRRCAIDANHVLAIATTHTPTTDLEYMLMKHPESVHETGVTESPRVCRRLQSLRGWSNEQTEDKSPLFAGGG